MALGVDRLSLLFARPFAWYDPVVRVSDEKVFRIYSL